MNTLYRTIEEDAVQIEMSVLLLGLWSALLSLFSAGMAWLVNRIFKMLDDLREEDELLRRDMHSTYQRRDDHLQFQRQIIKTLQRIEDKLDGKADKP